MPGATVVPGATVAARVTGTGVTGAGVAAVNGVKLSSQAHLTLRLVGDTLDPIVVEGHT